MSRPDFPAEQPAGYPDAGYPPAPPSSNFVPGDGYGRPVDPQAQTVALPADPTTFGAPDHAAGLPVPTPEPAGTPAPASGPAAPRPKHSRTGAAWVALIVAAIVFIFLLVFIMQNSGPVQVQYFGFDWTMSLGVAMMFAAVLGALTAGLLGTVRILQLRARAKRARKG
jgi:uncharacterized integral membrane protein